MTPGRKARTTALEAAAIAAGLLTAAWFVFRYTLYAAPSAAPAGAHPVEPRAEEAIVVAVSGDVVRLSPGHAPTPLVAGQRLLPDESVRTGHGARTDLQVNGRSRLTVAEGTQLTVREMNEKVHRFKLSRGRIAVDYEADGGRVLRIESDSGDAVAETKAARFGMLSTGASVAVSTETGAVRLSAQKTTVEVPAGTQSAVVAGRPPTAAEPIPARLLLKIAEAAPPRPSSGLCAEVEGVAPAGAQVLIDGLEVPLSPEGRFEKRVPAAPDKTSVLLAVRDAGGRETTREIPCAAAPSAANIKDFAIRWTRKRRP